MTRHLGTRAALAGAAAFLLAALTPLSRAEERPSWKPGSTWAVLVGVLEWKDPGLATFPKEDRKDRALERRLVADGVPAGHVVFLEDREATLEAIRTKLHATAERAGPGSTLVFYYAGHGIRRDKGKTYFANWDVDPARADATAFGVDELRDELHRTFRGERLLLMADCCHSGALATVVESYGSDARVRAACLTSSMASNVSTGQWTFTESIVSAFSGEGAIDGDGDGSLTFGEVDRFVHSEMRWREQQLTRGARTRTFDEGFVVRAVDPARRLAAIPGKWKLRDYVLAEWKGQTYPAQILAAEKGRYRIHWLGYGDDQDEWVDASRLREPPGPVARAGDALEVEWQKKWWPATVLEVDEVFALIHYDGYGPEWDEWVGAKRIRARKR